jgi:hypothetical protein
LLNERRDQLLRRTDIGERVGDDEGLEAGERVEWDLGDLALVQFLDVDTAPVRQRHGRRAKARRVGQREIDLVLGRHRPLEGDAIRLGDGVAVPVLGEVEALLLPERGCKV